MAQAPKPTWVILSPFAPSGGVRNSLLPAPLPAARGQIRWIRRDNRRDVLVGHPRCNSGKQFAGRRGEWSLRAHPWITLVQREPEVEVLEDVANGEQGRLVGVPDEAVLPNFEPRREPAENGEDRFGVQALRPSGGHQLGGPRAHNTQVAVGNQLERGRTSDVADVMHLTELLQDRPYRLQVLDQCRTRQDDQRPAVDGWNAADHGDLDQLRSFYLGA